MRHFFLILLFNTLLFVLPTQAQRLELGVDYGFSSYFGDLAPHSWKMGLSIGQSAYGINAGVVMNRHFTLRFGYMNGTIKGDDSESIDSEARKLRNLSFRSKLNEASVTAEINLLSWTNLKWRQKFQPIAIIGLALFNFDPMTEFDGQMMRLQPLGTEGQGLSRFPDRQRYKLNQVSIPLGFGFKYYVDKKVWLGMGMKYRMTFTDYLDDVSQTYVNVKELAAFNGPLSAELSFRSDEISDRDATGIDGTYRGNPTSNDWYLTSYISIGYIFDRRKKRKRRKGCPTFRQKKKMSRSYGI